MAKKTYRSPILLSSGTATPLPTQEEFPIIIKNSELVGVGDWPEQDLNNDHYIDYKDYEIYIGQQPTEGSTEQATEEETGDWWGQGD